MAGVIGCIEGPEVNTEAWKLVGFYSLITAELEAPSHTGTKAERELVGRRQCTKHRKQEKCMGTKIAQTTPYVECGQESVKWK